MDELIAGLAILSMIIVAVSMALGVNLKSWLGWVQVASGFLLGFLMGQNLAERMISAIFFTLLVIWFGPMAWKRLND
jgi:hypothetical protein